MAALSKRSRVLVVTSGQDSYAVIRKIIEGTCEQVLYASSVTEARRILSDGTIGLVVINTPLPDEFGLESAKDFADGRDIAVLLEAVGVMDSMRQKIYLLNEQNQKLRKRLDEMGIITRAKCLLIEKKKMTEEEAHRYLEQEAMNHALTKKEIAQNIIRELEE